MLYCLLYDFNRKIVCMTMLRKIPYAHPFIWRLSDDMAAGSHKPAFSALSYARCAPLARYPQRTAAAAHKTPTAAGASRFSRPQSEHGDTCLSPLHGQEVDLCGHGMRDIRLAERCIPLSALPSDRRQQMRSWRCGFRIVHDLIEQGIEPVIPNDVDVDVVKRIIRTKNLRQSDELHFIRASLSIFCRRNFAPVKFDGGKIASAVDVLIFVFHLRRKDHAFFSLMPQE